MNTRNRTGLCPIHWARALLVCTATTMVLGLTPALAQDQRPNILIIMTDDQSHDTLTDQFMPLTKSMIADQGITYARLYVDCAVRSEPFQR